MTNNIHWVRAVEEVSYITVSIDVTDKDLFNELLYHFGRYSFDSLSHVTTVVLFQTDCRLSAVMTSTHLKAADVRYDLKLCFPGLEFSIRASQGIAYL
jgi:hypothetical protein